MLTRNDNVTVTFYHLGLKEAMILVPLMNALKEHIEKYKKYEEYCNLSKEEQKEVDKVYYPHFNLSASNESITQIYEVLSSLGFEAVP
jgi:hypothetical protein